MALRPPFMRATRFRHRTVISLLKRTHTIRAHKTSAITVAATVGLTLVLLASTGFTFFASTETTDDTKGAQSAKRLSILYVNARYLLSAEQSLQREYQLEPDAAVARAHAIAAHELATALQTINKDKSAASPVDTRRLQNLYARYLAATHRLFAAVNAGDPVRAHMIERRAINPVFLEMVSRVHARLTESRHTAAEAYAALLRTQRNVVHIAVGLSFLGLASLFGFLFVIAAYRRRLIASHDAEMRRIEDAALVDSLTKIGNHRAFKEDIQRQMALAARHEVPLTLAMLDIDEFKMVNDQNGHVHGDRVLLELANVLSAGRAEDRAYRIGGDEFALILPHTPARDSRLILERIRSAASKSLHGSTVSIGYSTVEGVSITAQALQHQADAALYVAKRSGRNGVSQFDASNEGTWLLSTERVKSLRALLASRKVSIAFQPIWDLGRGNIFAFEALCRPSVSLGFPGPQDAFDLAERIGCAHELDRVSRSSALHRAAELPAEALLFLNVSPQTLDRNFDVGEFAASVAASGLRPERVVIEITERSIAHIDNVIAVARLLQSAGFAIALDDTGSGHAGLEIMSRLQFNYVKIDRAIIVKAMNDRSASGVVAAIVAFAQVTGAFVIAEGIENISMLKFIDRAGSTQAPFRHAIRGAQGFLLHRPSETLPTASDVQDVRALLLEHVPYDKTTARDNTPLTSLYE